jgi:hypothetical protein
MTAFPRNSASPPHWQWQLGGWLLVDRITGHTSPINLPEFDVFYSDASWYRDYAAYCGVSEDGKKVYAVVAQISRRKPVLKKLLDGEAVAATETKNASPDSACPLPAWQRAPIRVTFEPTRAAQADLRHPRPHSGPVDGRRRRGRSRKIICHELATSRQVEHALA